MPRLGVGARARSSQEGLDLRFRLARAARLGASRRTAPRLSGVLLILLALAIALLGALPAAAQEVACYAVADQGGGDGSGQDQFAEDLLTRIDPDDHDPATNETSIGTGTGTFSVEAATFQPGTGVLFAVDGGRLGTLNLESGIFSARPSSIGSGSGADGTIDFEDVDGLTFDPDTGTLYGSQRVRTEDPDVLLVIDPETGAHVPDAFGPGDDYVPITPLPDETKIDDLAIDADGTLFAIANQGGHGDHLVTIDRESGALTDVGPTGHDDIEGLTFAPDGRLLGINGKEGEIGEALWDIDTGTGAATNPRPLDNAGDYESVACIAAAQPDQPVSVSVEVGACPAPGSSTVPVTVTIEPPGSAVVTIDEGPGTPIIVEGDGAVLDLPPGAYHWDADPVEGFFMDDDSGEFAVEECPAVAPEVGSITIVKDSVPDSGVDFGFTGDLGSWALDEDGGSSLPSSRTFADLEAGTYEVQETAVDGWELTKIACIDPDDGTDVDVEGATATVDLDAGENVVCTFTNARLAVLGDRPPLPATGVPGLGVLSLVGGGMITAGFGLRSMAERIPNAPRGLRPGLLGAAAAYRVTGMPTPAARPGGSRWMARGASAIWNAARIVALERGPPRLRSP